MSTDSQKTAEAIGDAVSVPPGYYRSYKYDPELARLLKERQAEVERIVAQRKPELIQQGIEAYKRDLPRLLAENRYRQLVAYRGNDLVAFGVSDRQLRRRLAKKGFTDRGELFITSIAPLDVDEDDELDR